MKKTHLIIFICFFQSTLLANFEDDFSGLSIEQLMDIELAVTSVSKKSEPLFDAGAAVYVISNEMIRQSPATNIPDLLRTVPGVHVMALDNNKWAITSRGFNHRFSNKLLVLIDGRTVYTPLFSGVFWDTQDTLLDDIERIEVIRGPGAALWGANAVNGVINIITKSTTSTKGQLASVNVSDQGTTNINLRHGDSFNQGDFRVWSKLQHSDGAYHASSSNDSWSMGRIGFRSDTDLDKNGSITVSSELFQGRLGQTYKKPTLAQPYSVWVDDTIETSGGHLLARWDSLQTTDQPRNSLQLYYDYSDRDEHHLGEIRQTFDIDFHQRRLISDNHDFVWGLGYRYTTDSLTVSQITNVQNSSKDSYLINTFFQDTIELIPDQLSLTLGTKLEWNKATRFEYQPSIRTVYTPTNHQTIWGSISRTVRTPSRLAHDLRLWRFTLPPNIPENPTGVPQIVRFEGSTQFKSEELIAYELGYRFKTGPRWSIDTAFFYNDYDKLQTKEFKGYSNGAFLYQLGNQMYGESYGAEISTRWKPTDQLSLEANYSYMEVALHLLDSSTDNLNSEQTDEGNAPQQTFSLLTHWTPSTQWSLTSNIRYMDRLLGNDNYVNSYLELDLRAAWKVTQQIELALIGRNLLDPHHPEYNTPTFRDMPYTEVERSVMAQIRIELE